MANETPRFATVSCLSPAGLHKMAYAEYGDAANPHVLICVHGLTRVGRDFQRLALALADRYRVVCPDVVGRGASDWLRDPAYYALPQYVADMVTLIARLNVETVHWVGTSMGGLIGISLAGQPGTPITKLVINDVGPRVDPQGVARIASYVGGAPRFASFDEAVDYVMRVAATFGLRTREEWREITESVVKRDGDGYVLHYDPKIALPIRAMTPELAAASEAALWKLYDATRCPTLLLRGADSDLLSRETARLMTERGPRAKLVEFAGVGHAPMLMHEEQIAAVREFLLAD
ncbi:MAG TPA: alpha/beta hydrolase [Burkholderiaceae bacterium]|jgi:pimeloyl-ACP methyl ester carboxylesterase|nr:alpha/beta hydrolase [Burkholderiaceae bacterium]